MNNYSLDKTETLDKNGRILNQYTHTELVNATTIKIGDGGGNSLGTIENTVSLFSSLKNIRNIDISNMNLSNVTNSTDMFYFCLNLTTINIPSFDNLKEGYRMFENCMNLTYINNLSLPNCINYRAMFSRCKNLIEPPIRPENFKNDCDYRWMYRRNYT